MSTGCPLSEKHWRLSVTSAAIVLPDKTAYQGRQGRTSYRETACHIRANSRSVSATGNIQVASRNGHATAIPATAGDWLCANDTSAALHAIPPPARGAVRPIASIYAAVTSADTAKYLDAGVAVFAEPADPATSVLAFSTASWVDERADLQDRIEQCVTRAGRYNGYLYGVHVVGQRALILWQRPEAPPPTVGRYQLVAKSGSTEGDSQFVLVTRVTTEERTIYEAMGGETITYQVLVVTEELAEALRYQFDGNEPSRGEPSYSSLDAVVYETRYQANTVPFYSIAPITVEAETGDFSVVVDSLYRPLIPTLWSETPLADVTPAGDWPTLVSSNEDPVTDRPQHRRGQLGAVVRAGFGHGGEPGAILYPVGRRDCQSALQPRQEHRPWRGRASLSQPGGQRLSRLAGRSLGVEHPGAGNHARPVEPDSCRQPRRWHGDFQHPAVERARPAGAASAQRQLSGGGRCHRTMEISHGRPLPDHLDSPRHGRRRRDADYRDGR